MRWLHSGSKSRQLTVAASVWLAYAALFPLGHDSMLQDMYAAVSVLPTIVTAHLFGKRGAAVVASLFYPLHVLLFLQTDHTMGIELLGGVEGAIGMLVVPLMGLYVGYTSDLRRRLEETDASKDRFIAAVAHDIKTPLTGVLGLAITLRDEPELSANERELAAMVADEAQAAADIIEDLSVTALRNSGQFQVHPSAFDLGQEVWTMCRTMADVSLEVFGDVQAYADPRRVRQIVTNLLTNAIRHGSPPIDVYVTESRNTAVVEVTDRGTGIPPEAIDGLFEPFGLVGVSGHIESTGLGLSSARVLATLMGGDLTYRRSIDATTFRLSLPLATSWRPDVAPAPASSR